MAVTAKNYFSNAIVGVPQVGADVDVYKEDTSPKFALGTKFERQDGAVFRYVHFGATVGSAGSVCVNDISESGHAEYTSVVIPSSSSYQVDGEVVGVYPNMLGSKYIVLTAASIKTDEFAGGYITITSGPAAQVVGHTYRIKGNTITGRPASGEIRIHLYESLKAGLNSSVALTIAGNRWSNLEAAAASHSDLAAGINMIRITTANDYGWVQTQGIVGVFMGDATVHAGRMVSISTEHAAVEEMVAVANTTTDINRVYTPILGMAVQNSTALTFAPILVQME